MDDREVVAAIAAKDPSGIAVAYDTYAAGLYQYCHWLLRDPADAAEAMQDAFVIAAASAGVEAPVAVEVPVEISLAVPLGNALADANANTNTNTNADADARLTPTPA